MNEGIKRYSVLRHNKVCKGKLTAASGHNARLTKGNPDIDDTKTTLNIELRLPHDQRLLTQRTWDRIGQAGIQKTRKDAIVIVELMIQASHEYAMSLSYADQIRYFKTAYIWARKKYRDRVVSAIVHFDETTPHLHLCIVPLVRQLDGLHLSAKDLFPRVEMVKNQTELYLALRQANFAVVRGREASKARHQDAAEFKFTRISELEQQIQSMRDDHDKTITDLKATITLLTQHKTTIENTLSSTRDRLDTLSTQNQALEQNLNDAKKVIIKLQNLVKMYESPAMLQTHTIVDDAAQMLKNSEFKKQQEKTQSPDKNRSDRDDWDKGR